MQVFLYILDFALRKSNNSSVRWFSIIFNSESSLQFFRLKIKSLHTTKKKKQQILRFLEKNNTTTITLQTIRHPTILSSFSYSTLSFLLDTDNYQSIPSSVSLPHCIIICWWLVIKNPAVRSGNYIKQVNVAWPITRGVRPFIRSRWWCAGSFVDYYVSIIWGCCSRWLKQPPYKLMVSTGKVSKNNNLIGKET